jgi:hypothetical protein
MHDAAATWLHEAVPGHCGVTSAAVFDCRADSMGSFGRGHGKPPHTSWLLAAEACLRACLACERCNHIAISLWSLDCSWYFQCDAPSTSPGGFMHGSVRRSAQVSTSPPPPVSPPRTDLAVALQISGHLAGCKFPQVETHLRLCRERFTRCDAYLHTWSTTGQSTVHWSGGYKAHGNSSSAECLAKFTESIQPLAFRVDTQRHFSSALGRAAAGPPLAPDGLGFRNVLGQPENFVEQRHYGESKHCSSNSPTSSSRTCLTAPHCLIDRLQDESSGHAPHR